MRITLHKKVRTIPTIISESELNKPPGCDTIILEVVGRVGLITLNRAKAMNALNADMIKSLMRVLNAWKVDENILCVAIRGRAKNWSSDEPLSNFGNFCAGGDIKFFYEQLSNNSVEGIAPFFEEEYELDLLIAQYEKPYIAFMSGITMGGGMGISQGARLRVVAPETKVAMPETAIGLTPDVGAGYFLNRCPEKIGLYLALTGEVLSGPQAVNVGLADVCLPHDAFNTMWDEISRVNSAAEVRDLIQQWQSNGMDCASYGSVEVDPEIEVALDRDETVGAMVDALKDSKNSQVIGFLKRLKLMSPLSLELTLRHMRASRGKTLAQVLQLDGIVVKKCFVRPDGKISELLEGVRAKVVDKDNNPQWNPAQLSGVSKTLVDSFFV